MRKLLSILTVTLLTAGISCKKTGVPDVFPPTLQQIPVTPLAADYYIEDNPSSVYKIPVGFTTIADVDRTISFTYTSTSGAAAGTQYTAPVSVTIPAGKAVDTLRIRGLFSGYPAGRKDDLKVKLTGTVPNFAGKDSFMLTLQRYCAVVLTSLGGDYDNTFEGSYGPYTSSVINLTAISATTATGTITNIYDSNISATALFDWTDPAAFSVKIEPQQTQYTSGGLPIFVRTNPDAVSTFSSCENTITLRLMLYTSAGTVDSWTSSMAK